MTEFILNEILNSKISVDEVINWLTTDDPNDIIIAGIEQTDSTQAEFILYFLDYLRKECQGVLYSASSDGLKVEKPYIDIPPKMSGNIISQDDGNSGDSSHHELMDVGTKIGSPIVQATVENTLRNCLIASVSTGQVSSVPAQAQVSGNLDYEVPQSHSSPFKGPNERNLPAGQYLSAVMSAPQNMQSPIHSQMVPGNSRYVSPYLCSSNESPGSHSGSFSGSIDDTFSRHDGNLMGSEHFPAITSRSQVNDSCSSNLSMTSAVPCSPISPLYTNQTTPTKSKSRHNNTSRRSFNNKNSPGQNAKSGQKNKRNETYRTACLADFIVVDKSNSKQRNRNNSGNKSMEKSPGPSNKSSEVEQSNASQQKNSNSRRRIKPTKIVVDNNAENQQPETFGVVSRPPTNNPTFIEALSTDETNEVKSYEDERELLKLQRQKQLVPPLITEAVSQEAARNLIRLKQNPVVLPKKHLVEYANILRILAELHARLLTEYLVPNPMTELYFIVSLITYQFKVGCEVRNTQIQTHETCNETESLEKLKETMGCADLIDDNSEENIDSDMRESTKKDDSLSEDEASEEDKSQINSNGKQYFRTVHNCIYFATAVLWNAINVLSVFDRPTLALLCAYPSMKEFHPKLHRFLNKLYEEKCSKSKNVEPYDYSRSLQSNVCFQVDTDNRDNFPSSLSFSTFRKQRDIFYEILKTWEDNHMHENWSFQKMLGNKINTMLSMHSDAGNYHHLARLFKSQLLLSSIKIGHAEDSFDDANLDVLKSLNLNPEKLQQLQQRLVTPVSPMGPVPPPSFPGIQEFYRNFLLVSSDPKFTINLQDCFIQEIMELNDTQFMCSDIDAKESKANESTKQSYLLCVSTMRLLAKFLGFLISLPYQSKNDTLQSETTQIALRSRIMPPVDLQGCLYQAIAHKKLSVTIPWMVQFLAMLDSVSFRLPYYLNICKSLYCIYRERKYSLDDETALLIAFSIGWFFELPNFPRDIYFQWMKNLKNQKDELNSDLAVYTCRKVWPMNDDTGVGHHEKNVVVDGLNIIDDRALYICCPYLKELKLLLTSGNASSNSHNANRHITPVSSKLSQTSSASRTVSLELQLEEAFFHGHPRSVRRTVDFIVERISSSCVKFICRSIIPAVKEKTWRTIRKGSSKWVSSSKRDHIASATAIIRDQCYEVIPGMCESKTKSSMDALLADDILSAVKEMCVKIAVRMEMEHIYQWLDSYINNAMMSKAMFFESGGLRFDDVDKDEDENDENDDGAIGRPRRIETNNDDVPWATSVLNCVRNSLWELLENNGKWSTLDTTTVLDNVNKIYQSLTGSKIMVPMAQKLLFQISFDYAIHLIALKPELYTSDIEGKFVEIWKTYNIDDGASVNKILTRPLSPRNIKILKLSKSKTAWIAYGKFIQRMFKHNLLTIDNFSDDCVSLLRYEWTQEELQSFWKCITEAIHDFTPVPQESTGRIMTLLSWIIQMCGTMEAYP